ncbi:hypothetical protein BB559_005192 [Furculomyces boomerangus]|uniref:Acyl-CoA thioesterase II n=2 Tax=Harpellales TaxID=61421 RepID=A0A2T9YA59_9FUNG|nr:hypothetical protein BB559_005192 [Furculomyces boomerangus]PWA00366.1 hypothetical protein BB558_003586 [Smittium angustum]
MEKIESEIKEYFFVESKNWLIGGSRGLYGGQVIVQSLASATLTVPPEYGIHSMYSYFLLAGDYEKNIEFQVERIRDGRSFATRHVKAKQGDSTIFTVTCSFHKYEDYSTEIQYKMIDVYPPEHKIYPVVEHHKDKLPNPSQIFQDMNLSVFNKYSLISRTATFKDPEMEETNSQIIKSRLWAADAINLIVNKHENAFSDDKVFINKDKSKVNPNMKHPYDNTVGNPLCCRWFKFGANLEECTQQTQYLFIAMISDFWIPNFISSPYFWGYNYGLVSIGMIVTLDHTLYFHNNTGNAKSKAKFRADEWILFTLESPTVTNNKQFVTGKFYSQSGEHIASIGQETLFRVTETKKVLKSNKNVENLRFKLDENVLNLAREYNPITNFNYIQREPKLVSFESDEKKSEFIATQKPKL